MKIDFRTFSFGFLTLGLFGFNSCNRATADYNYNPVDYVNMFVGTSGVVLTEGNTIPAAQVPFGMASMNPINLDVSDTLRCTSVHPNICETTYEYGNPYMYGFSNVNQSGMGCNGSGSLALRISGGDLDLSVQGSQSPYSEEKAVPGYYSVKLDRFDVKSELTATTRSTISRFTFPGGKLNVVLDLSFTVDNVKSGFVKVTGPNTFEGLKYEGDFCECGKIVKLYFAGEFSRDAEQSGVFLNYTDLKGLDQIDGEAVGAYFTFSSDVQDTVLVKMGISYVSVENARQNLRQEQPAWEFDLTRDLASEQWKTKLSNIMVKGGSEDDKIKFYSAFYHCFFHPMVFSDVNGEYRTHEIGAISRTDRIRYTDFSAWDTYRTLHPLHCLVNPKEQMDMVQSLVGMYRESGWIPKLENRGIDSRVMVGDPCSIIISDTYMRGLRIFDVGGAYQGMRKAATHTASQNKTRRGFQQYNKYGYIPHDEPGNDSIFGWDNDLVWGTVSTSLEHYLADFALAQLAHELGKEEDYKLFYERSKNFDRLFDTSIGFFRPRYKDGSWFEPFSPEEDMNDFFGDNTRGGPGFVEGSAWNYLFFVPHGIHELKDLMGGDEVYTEKLQTVFDSSYFDMGNEPDIAFPFLFNYVGGQEWKTQDAVHYCIDKFFQNSPTGLPGNDDTGTLSAWLVFAMMGIFPDCPGRPQYQISSPVFDEISILTDPDFYSGKPFIIRTSRSSNSAKYIHGMKLNGKMHSSYALSHEDIIGGGILEIDLGEYPEF